MHGAGMTREGDCVWCAAGKYQTGVGLVAETNCTWCVAGKYQTGSGLHAFFRRGLLSNAPAAMMQREGGLCVHERDRETEGDRVREGEMGDLEALVWSERQINGVKNLFTLKHDDNVNDDNVSAQ